MIVVTWLLDTLRNELLWRVLRWTVLVVGGLLVAIAGCTSAVTLPLLAGGAPGGGSSAPPASSSASSTHSAGPANHFDPTPPDIPLSGSADGTVIAANSGGRAAFVSSFGPYAREGAAALGIDPSIVVAMAISESGGGNIPGNSFFGMKLGTSSLANGSVALQTWELVNGQRVPLVDRFATFATPSIAVQAWVNYILAHDPGVVGARTVEQFAAGLKAGGYMTDTAAHYAQTLRSIGAHDAP